MEKNYKTLLDAVRAINPSVELDKGTEGLVNAIDGIFAQRDKTLIANNENAITDAIRTVIGVDLKNAKNETVTIIEQLREMAAKMDKIESTSQRKMSHREKYMLRSTLEKNKDKIMEALRSKTPNSVEFEFNAVRANGTPAMMTSTNIVQGAQLTSDMGLEFDGELVLIRYPQNFIVDIISSRQVAHVPAHIFRREQNPRSGNAQIVAEGGLKPLVSYDFVDYKFDRDKYAAHMEWTDELEYDFEQLLNRVIDLFETDVLREWQSGVISKILTNASVYVSSALDGTIKFPDMYTAIGAAMLQVQSLNFIPDIIYMNPADVWAMNLTQDSNGNYKMPPIAVGNNMVAGLRVYISTLITTGKFLIGESRTWKEQHSSFITRIGMINDQFVKNEKTIIGEVYSLMYQATIEQGSWIQGDIATINAALQSA